METKSKTNEVLKYLHKNQKGITSLEAIHLFGATRLSDIIFRLRKKYEIDSIEEEVPTRYKDKDGKTKKVKVSRYILNESNYKTMTL